jgi:hypothetical protein
MSVLVTPRAVAPVAVPGPQIPLSVPKSPAAAVAVADGLLLVAADPDAAGPLGVLLERPHAANARTRQAAPETKIAGPLEPLLGINPDANRTTTPSCK